MILFLEMKDFKLNDKLNITIGWIAFIFLLSFTENYTKKLFNNIESRELSCNCYVYSNGNNSIDFI